MTTQRLSARHFDRLVRQVLHEIHTYGPASRRRRAGPQTADEALAVPVFDRGPTRAAPPQARGRP